MGGWRWLGFGYLGVSWSSSKALAWILVGSVRRVKVCWGVADAHPVAGEGGQLGEQVGEGVGSESVWGARWGGLGLGGGGALGGRDGVGRRERRLVCEQQRGESLA